MNADDDGFVNPKRILRMIGAGEDDLKILILKRYLLVFPSGVVVIKHWWINNQLRQDRHHPTTYKLEYDKLTKNEFGAYTEKDKKPVRQPNGNQMAPEYSIVESSIVKDSINTTNVVLTAEKPTYGKIEINEMFEYWEKEVGYKISAKVKQNRIACNNLLKKYKAEGLKQLVDGVALAQSEQYAPKISDFYELQSNLNKLIAWGNNRKTDKGKVAKIR